MSCFIIKIKKNLISIITILFISALILYSKTNIGAAKQGLSICVNNVFPSLFPFFIATEILMNTNCIYILGKILEKPVSKLFNVPGEGAFVLIMGIICGYPTGAKIVSEFKNKNIFTEEEAERLLAYSNNSGPLFILGTVGVSFLESSHLGYILLISHLISCIIVGIIFRNWRKINYTKEMLPNRSNKKIKLLHNNQRDFGEILSISIKNSISTIMNVCGFVVFFSIIISILNSSGIFNLTGNLFEKVNISSKTR